MEYKGIEFNLSDNFISKFKNKQPKWGPLGYFTYIRTYSRPLNNGKNEEFWQTLQRVIEGCFVIQKIHCKSILVPWNDRKAQKSAQEMYQRMWDFKFLPPGRGLWSMGTTFVFEKGSASLNNCGFVSTKNIDTEFSSPFSWLMDMSLLGVGVGFNTSGKEHEMLLKLPRISKEVHVIEDSREGWTEAFKRVLDSFCGKDSLPEAFDYSQIRPEGSPIKGFGGVAPGPKPLMELIEKTKTILYTYIKESKSVDSSLIVDLMNFGGEAVVAGGIRRTSEIALGNIDDLEFLHLKDQDKLNNKSLSRWASNNSIICKVGDKYSDVASLTAINGEPGYFWLDNARAYSRMIDPPDWKDVRIEGTNPCSEQSLESFELCNLVETFPIKHDNLDDYLRTLKYAYMYAKTVTLLNTNDLRTNAVMLRNRRIGLSQSGIIENINKLGLRQHLNWCDTGYKEVKKWDEIYSDWLCIPKSIKITTVKPSGTVSLLPGVTPGIHYPHSEYYIRRIRVSKTSHLWKDMKDAGYTVEPDKNQPEYTMVIDFPVHEPNFHKRKDEVSMWEQLELAAQMQAYWSDNQVSITVTFKDYESKDIVRALELYETRLKSVSFLPLKDHNYVQAPYEAIDEERYKELISKLKKTRLTLDEEGKAYDKFCDGDTCTL